MDEGHRHTRRRATRAAVGGALVVAAAGMLAHHGSSESAAAISEQANLVCAGTEVVEFTPKVVTTPRHVDGRGTGLLDDCRSPNHTQDTIRSGEITFTLAGTVSCTQPSRGTGSLTITWYGEPGRRGPVIGTTTVDSIGDQTLQGDVGGRVDGSVRGLTTEDSTLLRDQEATTSISAANDTVDCLRSGLRELPGKITVAFRDAGNRG